MTRLTPEILHDDEALADWCEASGPSPENETPVAEHFLRCAVEDGESEQRISQRVAAALSDGATWTRVAQILGLSVDETERRFARAEARPAPGQP